jgi:group I intron endonuclease
MIIYKATNTINGKCYVGQTKYSLEKRKVSHIRSAYNASKRRTYFHWALREYGKDNFSWEVLAECFNQEGCDNKEQFFIEKSNSNDPDHG